VTETDPAAGSDPLDAFDGIVYDLDGTLVRLVVDWDAVARDAAARFRDHGVDADGHDLWAMLDLADERGLRTEIETVIGDHERAGARDSHRLPLADRLGGHDVPVGVCSLNCEASARIALETHGLAAAVGAVVGRDTLPTRKPDPEPLLATLRRLDVDPGRAVFVGDSPRDRLTADRAGVAYRSVDSFRSDRGARGT
jgi:phosphoglycolate phosphatase